MVNNCHQLAPKVLNLIFVLFLNRYILSLDIIKSPFSSEPFPPKRFFEGSSKLDKKQGAQ